ncbi:hypothetical protein FS837_003898, partial [Tulasnella sp. UAMH 9824]
MQPYGNAREDLNGWDFPSSADLLSNICGGPVDGGGQEPFWLSEGLNQDTTPIATHSTQPPSFTQPPREQSQVQNEEPGAWPVQLPLQNLPASEPSPASTILNSPWPTSPAPQPSPIIASEQGIGFQSFGYPSQPDWSSNQASAVLGTGELLGAPTPCTNGVQAFNSLRSSGAGAIELDPIILAQLLQYTIPHGWTTHPDYFGAPPPPAILQALPPESGPNHLVGTAGNLFSPLLQDRFLAADGRLAQREVRPQLQIRYDRHCDPSVIPEVTSSPSTTAIGSAWSSPLTFMQHSPSPSVSLFDPTVDPGSPMELQVGNAHLSQSSNAKNPGCRCGRTFKDEKQHWRN